MVLVEIKQADHGIPGKHVATITYHEQSSVRSTKSEGQMGITISSHKDVINPAQEGPEGTSRYMSRWPRFLCHPPLFYQHLFLFSHLWPVDKGGKSLSMFHGWIAKVRGCKLKMNAAPIMIALKESDEGWFWRAIIVETIFGPASQL